MGLFGTDSKGKQRDVSFGHGGSAVQAHREKAARLERQRAARAQRQAAADRRRSKR